MGSGGVRINDIQMLGLPHGYVNAIQSMGELGQEFVSVQALSVTDRRVKRQC